MKRLADLIPGDWRSIIFADGADLNSPGIYEWKVDGVSVYVGKFTKGYRPRREYCRNVFKLCNGLPYRPGNLDGFRWIHRRLAHAYRAGSTIEVVILENCPTSQHRERENFHRKLRGLRDGGDASEFALGF